MANDTRTDFERAEDRLIALAKVEAETAPEDTRTREQLRKAATPAQLEYLRHVNPGAAEAWERARGLTG
jgi:hypothetical protein